MGRPCSSPGWDVLGPGGPPPRQKAAGHSLDAQKSSPISWGQTPLALVLWSRVLGWPPNLGRGVSHTGLVRSLLSVARWGQWAASELPGSAPSEGDGPAAGTTASRAVHMRWGRSAREHFCVTLALCGRLGAVDLGHGHGDPCGMDARGACLHRLGVSRQHLGAVAPI